MKTNTKYKNSVFSYLFSNPYALIEHQSTINPNMALRLLMYIARVYEKIIEDANIYSAKKIFIPQPEFFVLYNGIDPFPDTVTLKLSDMFKSIEDMGLEKSSPVLELEVTVLNINEGRNETIAKRCGLLAQYSAFTGKVRELMNEGHRRQEALKKAVVYCRNHDILKKFLERNGSEVFNMLMVEWDMDKALAVRYEEGREYFLQLLNQGLSVDEIKLKLVQEAVAKEQ